MPSQDFSSWATLQLPPSSRLFPSACCPDKDLVVVVSRLGSKDQISLWKMQGSKKWDVVVDTGNPHPEEVVDITWSSDGALFYTSSLVQYLSLTSRSDYCAHTRPTSNHASFCPGRRRATCDLSAECRQGRISFGARVVVYGAEEAKGIHHS